MINVLEQTDFDLFLASMKEKFAYLFNTKYDFNTLSLQRDLPAAMLSEIMDLKPLSVAIPTLHGGRGSLVKECLGVLSAASYESLSLSLIFGINIALFIEPLAKYGDVSVKDTIFRRFLEEKAMGGLMITEKAYGSDALNMQTAYNFQDEVYRIKGQKHWQGLTGAADYWLVTARKRTEKGDLVRDIDFFVTEEAKSEQKIKVSQRYNNLGLYAIPYGVNEIDIAVPANQKLNPESTGIKLMLDTLHRSRLQFPGMGMGFIKRLLDETLQHTQQRRVSGLRLNEVDAVKFQLSRLQAAYTVCSGMCAYSTKVSSIDFDLSGHAVDANSVKALVTDLMQESAQIALQLAGANGYRLDHIAGRAVVDSRPFQIFEGSNEMLYSQVAESILKTMRRAKERNLLTYLKTQKLTELAAPFFPAQLDIDIQEPVKQRDLVTLGRMVARVISFQFVLSIGEAGFNPGLVEITRQHMHMDLSKLAGQFHSKLQADPLLEYQENADWMGSLNV